MYTQVPFLSTEIKCFCTQNVGISDAGNRNGCLKVTITERCCKSNIYIYIYITERAVL